MKPKINTLIATIVAGLLLIPVVVYAQPHIANELHAVTLKRCMISENRLGNLDGRVQERVILFEKQDNKISNLLQKAKSKGADTSKGELDLSNWKSMTDQIKLDKQSLDQKVEATKQLSCGNGDGRYKTAMQAVQDELKKINQDAQQKRDYYVTNLKSDLQAVSHQLKKKH